MAPTAMPMSPWPVISTTGRLGSRRLSSTSNCRPSMPGRRMSLTTMPAKSPSTRARASSALPTPSLGMSSRASACWQPSSTWGSSSTIRTHSASFMGRLRGGRAGEQRQAEDEGGAAGFRVTHAEIAAGGGGEAGRQGQAEAEALFAGLGGEEGFEQVAAQFRGDARAVVAHLQAVAGAAGRAAEPEVALGLRAHGVQGVADQVDQDLFQAGLVDAPAGSAGVGVLDLRRAALQARLQQHQRGVHRLAQAGLAVVIGAAGGGGGGGGGGGPAGGRPAARVGGGGC